jgi:anti-sigma B factor antagonist
MDIQACVSVVVEAGDPAVVRLVGELDLGGVPEVRARFAELDGDVDVDCSGLDFIDASGLCALVAAHTAREARGAKLVIVGPSPRVKRVLELTSLDAALHVRWNGPAS